LADIPESEAIELLAEADIQCLDVAPEKGNIISFNVCDDRIALAIEECGGYNRKYLCIYNLDGLFLQGYFDADGNFDGVYQKATSVSKELLYGIGQCVAKVYQVPYKIYRTARKRQTTIEGRIVNQRDSYQIVFKKKRTKQDKAFYEDGYIWFPIKSIATEYAECPIFNMEVETDNSYTANGCIVHNCQDISTAGKQAGLIEGSDTRSSIIWYTKYAIQQKKPKYLLGENVKNLVGKNHRGEYFRWLQFLESEGYTNYYTIINAKDQGIPQNRERVFTFSVHGDHDIFHFPASIPLELRLKDILEEEVDDKYVLSETAIQGFLKHNENHKAKGTGFLWIPKDVETTGGGESIANCLRGTGALCPTDNTIREIRCCELSEGEGIPECYG
jgi:hypothetical protein